MIPLKRTKQVLTWLCVYPADKSASKSTRLKHIVFSSVLFILNLNGLAASAAYFLKFVSNDLESALYALFQTDSLTAIAYTNIVLLLSQHKIVPVFEGLTQIYKENANKSSFRFLAATNNRCEWLWEFYFVYVMGGYCGSLVLASIGSILYCLIFVGQFDKDYLFMPYRLILPWNRETPLGYFGEIVFGTLSGQPYFVLNGVILLLFVSMCLHHQAFFAVFQYNLRELQQAAKFQNRMTTKYLMCNLIRFHASAKSWFFVSSDAYSHFIVVQLIANVIYMACSIFELDLKIKDIDFDIFLLLIALSTGCLSLFLLCFFGKMTTESYANVAASLYDFDWYELPISLQMHWLFMIRNAQRTLHYQGFRVATLDLETFSKMLKTVFSYYMMFKTVTSE